jgi:hypothetical protein
MVRMAAMEDFKRLSEVTEPDVRSQSWVVIDRATGQERRIQVADLHAGLERFRLTVTTGYQQVVEFFGLDGLRRSEMGWFRGNAARLAFRSQRDSLQRG